MLDRTDLISRFETIRQSHLDASDWQHEQLSFVSLRGSWFAQSEADFDLEEEINKFFTGDKKVLLLLGDSGAGKSLYTQGLAIKLWKTHDDSKPIPIWISLPSLKDPVNHPIEETLANYGFTPEQIETLKRTQRFIFILDAYDEIRQLKNLYVSNHLDQWQCQIIITCRREYLYREDNYQLYFKPFQGERPLHTAYNEIVIRPFNANQIQAYIKQYVLQQDAAWKEAQKYGQAIEEIPGLKNLITTPFILKLTMEVLPQIFERYQTQSSSERRNLTQAALYDAFIEQWFIRQEQKLKAACQIEADENIKPEFWNFAKALAQAMHERNITQVHYEIEDTDLYGDVADENPWKQFFDPADKRVGLLQTACLIREVSTQHYVFIHSSLLEYFLTRNLYENMLKQDFSSQQSIGIKAAIAAASGSEVAESSKIKEIDSTAFKWQQEYFNQRLLVREQGTLQFLADRVEEEENFLHSLFERVYASRTNSEMRVAAGNAITILNLARISFSGKDLHGICIGGVDSSGKSWGADLSHAVLDSADLSGADLHSTYLFQAWLNNANLTGASVDHVNFGEWPSLPGEYFCGSQDGRLLVTAVNKILRIYSTDDYHLLREITTSHKKNILAIAVSSDSKLLATGSKDKTVRLWKVKNGRCSKVLKGHTKHIRSVAFSYDDKLLASGGGGYSGDDYAIRLWEVKNGRCTMLLQGHVGDVESLSFSQDNRQLASAGGFKDNIVRVWQVETGKCNKELLHKESVSSVAFSHSNRQMASGTKGEVWLWDVESGLCTKIFTTDNPRGLSVAFSHDDKRLAAGNLDIQMWDIESSRCIRKLEGHSDQLTNITFNNDDMRLVSGSHDKTIRIWDISSDQASALDGHVERVWSVTHSFSSKLVATGSLDATIALWEVASGRRIKVLNVSSSVISVTFSHNDKLLASGNFDNTVQIWNVENGQCEKVLSGHIDAANSVAFSNDDKQVASSGGHDDKTIRLWKLDTGECKVLETNNCEGHCIAFSHNSKWLASGTDEGVLIWKVETGRLVKVLKTRSKAESDDDRSETKHETFSGIVKFALTGGLAGINDEESEETNDLTFCIAFSHHDKWLASGYLNDVRIWDVKNERCERVLEGHYEGVTGVAFTNNDERLVSGGYDKKIRIWEVKSGKCLLVLPLPFPVTSLSLSGDDRTLCVSNNTAVLLFKIEDKQNQLCATLLWHTKPALSSQGIIINKVTGLSDQNLKLLQQRGEVKGTSSSVATTSKIRSSGLSQPTTALPKGTAEASAKRGLFARFRVSRGTVNKYEKNKKEKDKNEQKGSLSKKQ